MLITNFGLFWKAEDVFWGKPNNAGALMGRWTDNAAYEVDFREQRGIYVLYAEYDIVYVGQAGTKNQRLLARLHQHQSDALANRWNRFSWFGIRRVLDSGNLAADNKAAHLSVGSVMNHLEAVLITTAEPPLNRQGGRWGNGVEQYLQIRDERLGPSVEEMIKNIHDKND